MRKCLLFLLLSGCALGPNYQTPENDIVDTWGSEDEINVTSTNPPVADWWKLFHDPLLDQYVEKAKENNFDLLTAESNILQARALRQIEAGSFYPQIGADVNATRTYFSKNGPLFAIGPSTGSLPGTVSSESGLPFSLQAPQMQNLYNILFDFSWEIDLFGKTKRRVEAADALVERTIDEKNDILISIIAELARNYVELRGFQEKKRLIEENISLISSQSQIIFQQLQFGLIGKIDNEQIEAALLEEKAKLPGIEAQIFKNIYMLSILTGSVPETLVHELEKAQSLPNPEREVAIGLRSDLIRRRPDIRRAERNLAAATANIGVAIASFFPTFNLIGDGGIQSLELKNLFSLASRTWAVGGDLATPIYKGGKLIGNLQAKKAETAAALYTYQQTILKALEETESAITSYSQDLKATQLKAERAEKYQTIALISNEQHKQGLIDLLKFLNAQRELNTAEETLLNSQITTLIDLIALYKAIGGGWESSL